VANSLKILDVGKNKGWISFVLIHVIFMGVWGAIIEIPENNGFPATLGYVVWALTMIPTAIVALHINKWKLKYDRRSIFWGCLAGLLGIVIMGSAGICYAIR